MLLMVDYQYVMFLRTYIFRNVYGRIASWTVYAQNIYTKRNYYLKKSIPCSYISKTWYTNEHVHSYYKISSTSPFCSNFSWHRPKSSMGSSTTQWYGWSCVRICMTDGIFHSSKDFHWVSLKCVQRNVKNAFRSRTSHAQVRWGMSKQCERTKFIDKALRVARTLVATKHTI